MKIVISAVKYLAGLLGLVALAALLACNDRPTASPVTSFKTPPRTTVTDMTDAKRLSDGATKLINAINKPTDSFHFSFKGQENINDKYAQDHSQLPQAGPVTLQTDVSPDEIQMTETRGKKTRKSTAKKEDEANWTTANLTTLGVLTGPNLVITVGSTVTSPPSTDLVGSTMADKFTFDTTTATPSQKLGLEAARAILPSIKDCKGTAWIALDSGLLIKFNVDADYLDKNDHAWKEHYEGEVSRK